MDRRSPEPFMFRGSVDTGILLLHGFTGSPAEMRRLGEFLSDQGYMIYAPLLSGHGETPEKMEKTTWHDWWQSTVQGYKTLQSEGCKQIIAIGLSMGGILALNLARQYPLTAVVSLSAPIFLRDRRAFLAKLLYRFHRFEKVKGSKPEHIAAEHFTYDEMPVRCVASLYEFIQKVKRHLWEVVVPALICQGELDETVIPKSAQYIYDHIGSEEKSLIWYPHSSHVITLDHEREKLFGDIHMFIKKQTD